MQKLNITEKQFPKFVEKNRQRAKEYYESRNEDPEYEELLNKKAKHYQESTKAKIDTEKIKEYYENYIYNKKLKEVV